jgi:uncharacterized protein YegL
MKKIFLLALIAFSLAFPAFSQSNLVLNPSFEDDGGAPAIEKYNWRYYETWKKDSLRQGNRNLLTKNWWQPTAGTPDYLNSDRSSLFGFSTQTARTGKGRFGIIAGIGKNSFSSWLLHDENYSEYLETKLAKPLEKGKTYCVRYYVSLDKRSHFACDNFGAIISSSYISTPDYEGTLTEPSTPDLYISADDHFITTDEGWKMICITFVANGGEQFLTIGSFMKGYAKNRHEIKPSLHRGLRWMPDCKYSYYYIDDVSLAEVKSGEPLCTAAKDTVARNNLVILLDVSGSMQQKNFIDSIRIATLDFVNALNPADLVSIIAFHSDTQILVSSHPAGDTAFIRRSFEGIRSGGATNIGLALQSAYGQVRRHPLDPGNNRIILITDGRVHISDAMKKMMKSAADNEGVEFSVIFLGKLVPDEMVELADDMHGSALAADPSEASKVMIAQSPVNEVSSPYGSKKAGKIIVWHVLTKIFFPVILIGMAIMKVTRFM